MPTENRSSNTEMVSVPREWLNSVALLQMPLDELQEQAIQHLCEPCDEPAPQPHPEPIAWMVGLGPMTDSGEVDQLREVIKHSDDQIMRQSLRISNQRAQLAERDSLLDRVVDHAKFWHDHPYAEVVEGIAKDYKALSASAEPEAKS